MFQKTKYLPNLKHYPSVAHNVAQQYHILTDK